MMHVFFIFRNPVGRTGIRGRGCLGRWGPNHAADPIVTRFVTLRGLSLFRTVLAFVASVSMP